MRSKGGWFKLIRHNQDDADEFGDIYKGILAIFYDVGTSGRKYLRIAMLQSRMTLPGYFKSRENAEQTVEELLDGYDKDLQACVDEKTIPPGMSVYYKKLFERLEKVPVSERTQELRKDFNYDENKTRKGKY